MSAEYSVEQINELVENLMSCCRCIGYAASGNERANHIAAASAAKEKLISAFTHPPAQGAQVDRARGTPRRQQAVEMLLELGWTYNSERGWEEPATTAEPVAQGEATEFPDCSGDPSSCPENEGHGCCKAPSPDPTDGIGLSRFQAQFDDGDEE